MRVSIFGESPCIRYMFVELRQLLLLYRHRYTTIRWLCISEKKTIYLFILFHDCCKRKIEKKNSTPIIYYYTIFVEGNKKKHLIIMLLYPCKLYALSLDSYYFWIPTEQRKAKYDVLLLYACMQCKYFFISVIDTFSGIQSGT